MPFTIILFVILIFMYDQLRGSMKNQQRQIKLMEQLTEQNEKIIELFSRENRDKALGHVCRSACLLSVG